MARKKRRKETELYPPIKELLESNGYNVRAEVKNCDIAAIKGDELAIIEMKTSLNIELLAQAADRQRVTSCVYIAIPAPTIKKGRAMRKMLHLIRRLEMGLIYVYFKGKTSFAEIVFHPSDFLRRKYKHREKAIIQEIASRSENYNTGGSTRKKLITAYRLDCIRIACCLRQKGPLSPALLRKLGTGPKTTSILGTNHYRWFIRIERGVYNITPKGLTELETFKDIADKFLEEIDFNLIDEN